MKNKLFIPVAIATLFISMSFNPADNDCQPYYPVKAGAVREMKIYKANDKLSGRVVQTIKNAVTSGNTLTISATSVSYDDKDKQTGSVDFTAKCDGGVFYFNMAASSGANPAAASANMDVKVTGDFLDFPSNPTDGQALKGGTLTMSMTPKGSSGMATNMVTTISNRKVESASVSVTTPAGTFNCVKISYDVSTKMMFNISSHAVEWYSKNVGMVRSETYSDKGKLAGYSVLSSITNN